MGYSGESRHANARFHLFHDVRYDGDDLRGQRLPRLPLSKLVVFRLYQLDDGRIAHSPWLSLYGQASKACVPDSFACCPT